MKLLSHLHHGFTLIELMIVIAIIGILAPIAYPQAMGYIERAHDLELRMAYKQLFTVIDQYILDKGGVLESLPSQAGNSWEWYAIAYQDMTGPAILGGGWERHDGLSQYIQGSPEAQSAISTLIPRVTPWGFGLLDTTNKVFYVSKTTPSEYISGGGRITTGLPTGNEKFTNIEWARGIDISPYAGSASSTDGDYFDAYSWNGIDYPAGYSKIYYYNGDDAQANKACFPGRSYLYYTDTNGLNFVGCTYFFGQ